ncbi:MAG: hypothetical protein NZX77_19085, partial [Polyangiaceae bacterium]|nr:hypothetical protein [Polyangiaceae bacterium]
RGPKSQGLFSSLFVQNFWTYHGVRGSLTPDAGVFWVSGGRRGVLRGQGEVEVGWLRAGIEGALAGMSDGMASASVEAGKARGGGGGLRIDGQQGRAPLQARWLREETPWIPGWFAAPVWSGEAGGEVPLGGGLRLGARGWAEFLGGRWLGHRLDVLYASSCGCLRVGVHGSKRVGREGMDLWGTLTLG